MRGGFVPGDVAMVTWKAMGEWRTDVRIRAKSEACGDVWWGGTGWIGDYSAKDVRPLVVIDPEDREQVERLAALLWPHYAKNKPARLRKAEVTADALRGLIAAPRCSAHVNLSGADFQCVEPPRHGGGHRNPDAEAVWGDGE